MFNINILKITFAILCLFSLDSYSNYTEKLLNYEYSFHHMLVDPAPDEFERTLKPKCIKELRSHLKRGNNFYVSDIENATISAAEYRRNYPEFNNRYFHRTEAEVVIDLANNQDFNSMYKYIRGLNRSFYLHLSSIFVADHPTRMDRNGPYLIEISPAPDARFLIFPDTDSPRDFLNKLRRIVKKWIMSNHPNLLDCYTHGTTDYEFTGNAIDYLAMEASRADWVSHGTYFDSLYLFIVNPFTIDYMSHSPLQ